MVSKVISKKKKNQKFLNIISKMLKFFSVSNKRSHRTFIVIGFVLFRYIKTALRIIKLFLEMLNYFQIYKVVFR